MTNETKMTGNGNGNIDLENLSKKLIGRTPENIYYLGIFDMVCGEDWKDPILCYATTHFQAEAIRKAIIFFHGGCEMSEPCGNVLKIESKGYNVYTGEF